MEFTEIALNEITDEMPASRAYRIRAREYTSAAYILMCGKSGLSKKEQRKLLKVAAKFTKAATSDLASALEASKH